MDINKLMNLPCDILNIIWSYINPIQKIFLNKTLYNKYNHLIDKLIINQKSYVRDIIRLDYIFVFNNILSRNFNKWILINNYHYANVIYPSYINFLYNFACQNKSNKCMDSINFNLNISKLKKLNCKDYRIKKKLWIT